ncbi:MAG: hypothetical protein OET63_11295, partial [Desulfobacterales bacterium]|nr:hypothetical protein [Desulfobacterales bacterium]
MTVCIWCVPDRPLRATDRGSPTTTPLIVPIRSRVVDEIETTPPSVAEAIRAALFTVIPRRSSCVRITSPVCMPIRISNGSSDDA